MSGAITATQVIAAVAGAGLVSSVVQGQQQQKQAKSAAAQAQANAEKQAKVADEQMNQANQKRADPNAALDAALQSGKSGVSSTMLTGAQGIDPNQLSLGKSTLLGG